MKGWVRSVRDQKQFAFIDLNDGSTLSGLQIVIDNTQPDYASISAISTGCSVSAVGEIVHSVGKGQTFEMRATNITLIGSVTEAYPLQKKRHSLQFLRSIAHLRGRTNSAAAVARIRSVLAAATHQYFSDLGFIYLNSPIITTSDCEGAGDMFGVTTLLPPECSIDDVPRVAAQEKEGGKEEKKVDFSRDFFHKPAFLSVSGQLWGESYACGMGDVYTFGPTFRAENSNTSRHLAEFWMIEPEMAFADLAENMDGAEAYVKYVISAALEKCDKDVEFLDRFIEKGLLEKLKVVVKEPFARITYSEAIEVLEVANKRNKKGKRRFEYDVSWGVDLQSEHERYLAEEHFKRPVFVSNYPSKLKAFYMRGNDEDDGRTVAAMDLLVPHIGELVGGSVREERLEVLERKLEEHGLEKEQYWWYLDLRRYGTVPHAGYGVGFERLIQFVSGMENIRDVIPFPRYPGSADF